MTISVRALPLLGFYRGHFYQRFPRNAITAMPVQRAVFEGLTPASAGYSGGRKTLQKTDQTARHSHSAICPMTSPNSSSAADHTSADTKLAA
jgi:hypothetical protein